MSFDTPKRLLITGATGGIGGALALEYAGPGIHLWLQGRREGQLATIALACEAKGATVHTERLDVRDCDALRRWVSTAGEDGLDLIILAAGLNTDIGTAGEGEQWSNVEALLDVNVLAVMASVDAVLPAMRSRKRGQIALFSSLAGWRGLPITPSYSASKAAIRVYGEALRDWLEPDGISVNVILPGYVESKMCHEMPGPKPFLWDAARAARRIRRGLNANQARISFPFPLNLGCWLLSVIPQRLSSLILKWLDYRG